MIKSIHISKGMTGKLAGIQAISTNSLYNDRCNSRKNIDGSICQKCFAGRTLKCYKSLNDRTIENGEILSKHMLSYDELPIIKTDIFRFECFGDVINRLHALNYLLIAIRNPETTFSLFTKNIDIVQDAIAWLTVKPDNLIIVQGSVMINRPERKRLYSDKVFTVYNKKAIEQGQVINCGAKSCRSCMLCYTKNDTIHISEELK